MINVLFSLRVFCFIFSLINSHACNHKIAYSNENGRTDVEGCCWWGRGVLQTKGICSFGRLNYYLGKRAADEGRESLFPSVNFCSQPEAICGSRYRHELTWMVGLFEWIDRVQSYDKGGFNYMNELRIFADNGMTDTVFIQRVGAIIQSGCHSPPCESAGCLNFPCDGASPVDEGTIITKAFRTFSELDLWDDFPLSGGGSNAPSPAPTPCSANCTDEPTHSPFTPPTIFPSASPTQLINKIIGRFEELKEHIERRRQQIESTVFMSETDSGFEPSKLYSLDGFLAVLEDFATEGVEGLLFNIGQVVAGDSLEHGLVNIALFLSHAMTRGILWDSCEEVNTHLLDGKLPISNSCGQHGLLYDQQFCLGFDVGLECPVDESMKVTQVSVGNSGSPPFFCAPKSTYPFTGYFDPLLGITVSSDPFANAADRADVSGCCFWGRGILLNAGICDIGRFNHQFGLPAIMDGQTGGYGIDFCSHPDAICSDYIIPPNALNQSTSIDTSKARYQIGMIFWIQYVQEYDSENYNYLDELRLFVDGGFRDFLFVDEFSEIIVDSSRDGSLRKSNFMKILEVFFMGVTESPTSSSPSTISPTISPSTEPSTLIGKPANETEESFGSTPGSSGSKPGSPGSTPGTLLDDGSQPGPLPGPNPSRPISLDLTAGVTYVADMSDAHTSCFGSVWITMCCFLLVTLVM
jgi:hypothetical protein